MAETKKQIDFSKYRIIPNIKSEEDKEEDDEDDEGEELTIYKYSDLEGTTDEKNQKLVHHYFYDDLSESDIKNSFIILFAGKTGDGKSTAINAFFNIVKGVTIKDNYRFILIEEKPKPKGQAESQTDGVHLYYLKDYKNEPLIIIDSQGYGDTRGHDKDLEINSAFEYVFSNVIDHINTICFIAKSTNNRIDISTKYIYSCVTALFAEDVNDNFIVLATHANKDSMKKPAFVETIVTDADFLKFDPQKKWWYAFDSKSIFDKERDKMSKFSFKELKKFYEDFVKISFPKNIKNCAIVLSERNSLRREVQKLQITFKHLMMKQKNLKQQDELIMKNSIEIEKIQERIKTVEEMCKDKDLSEQEQLIRKLNEDLKKSLVQYCNQTVDVTEKRLKSANERHTYCNTCKENCHSPCTCWLTQLGRCSIFEVAGCWGITKDINDCEHCGHHKSEHAMGNNRFETVTKSEKKNNEDIIRELESKSNQETQRIQETINKKKGEQKGLQQQKDELNNKKLIVEKEKKQNMENKENINKEIDKVTKEILIILIDLQKISKTLEDKALNHHHIKTQNDYIDSLNDQLDDIGDKDEKIKKKKLKRIKQINDAFIKSQSINVEDLKNMDANELTKKMKDFVIPDEEEEEV